MMCVSRPHAPRAVLVHHKLSSLLKHAGPRALFGRSDSVSVFVFLRSGFSLLFLYSLAVAPLLVSADETLTVALLAGAILGPLMTK